MHEDLIVTPVLDQVVVYQEPVCNDGSTIEDLIASFVKAKFAQVELGGVTIFFRARHTPSSLTHLADRVLLTT